MSIVGHVNEIELSTTNPISPASLPLNSNTNSNKGIDERSIAVMALKEEQVGCFLIVRSLISLYLGNFYALSKLFSWDSKSKPPYQLSKLPEFKSYYKSLV